MDDSENVVFSYGDGQALEDGVLVDVTFLLLRAPDGKLVNRITHSIFCACKSDEDPEILKGEDPMAQANRGILMMAVGEEDVFFSVKRLRKMIDSAKNFSDGWYTGTHEGKDVWLADNEVDGFTLMFPEDH